MDSFTQILLGASVAAAVVPKRHRRAALLAGAALGTLPDLDSFPIMLLTDDPVALMTLHRGFSHSLLVLPFVAWAIWAVFRRRGGRVAEAPARWFWAMQLALVTHPLLDAFTVYGTQLLWPLPLPPVMWSSVFIIDPMYTLWLFLGVVVAAFAGTRPIARRALVLGLALSSVYLGWSLLAKEMVDREAGRALAGLGLADAPRFSVPMPFNTLLWRVVAMTPDGFVEGERSLVADRGPMRFRRFPSETAALADAAALPAVRRLAWFNHGFMKAQVRDGRLVVSDLRMGAEPDYSFNFAVAERDGAGWRPIPPEQLSWPWQARRRLGEMWTRIWNEPRQADPPAG
ncbi:metal-dependent hydrolase [Luteimonas sp. SJ-92]|uniref:Metal-dependent hydrolase n=1 Tax=Luteimonas salinisoli TaxID=2752307 RepID=A0A853J941_9GAMM|nr:metal-dependent hydrolase [Luteimonas salinisoli]NZA25292.1 metal-dependent hydrolase [Luteimonas salinisoli]